jgi:erythromycin esterase
MNTTLIAVLTAGLLLTSAHTDPALDTAARPLHTLGATVGHADVVGVGEATHGAHEFFRLQTHTFMNLVRDKGFGTFAREVSWSAGLRLDDYVVHGTGDPARIMREEFQANYLWNTEEYLDLVQWMRAHNQRHRDKVRFMGDDIAYPGPELFDRVRTYAQRHRPWLVAELDRLHDGLAPTAGITEWLTTYPGRPAAERAANRDRAWQAVDLLLRNDSDPWTVQHARVIAQSMTMWASPDGFRYRDEAMADNVLWWRAHTGDKIVLAAHDGHVAEESYWASYPRVQGTYLRERLGDRYLSVGTTFHHGGFHLFQNGQVRTVAVGPPAPDHNESTLDTARLVDFVLDTRTGPREWLAEARPTRQYAESFPDEPQRVALGRSFDVVVHFHEITPSRLLP